MQIFLRIAFETAQQIQNNMRSMIAEQWAIINQAINYLTVGEWRVIPKNYD